MFFPEIRQICQIYGRRLGKQLNTGEGHRLWCGWRIQYPSNDSGVPGHCMHPRWPIQAPFVQLKSRGYCFSTYLHGVQPRSGSRAMRGGWAIGVRVYHSLFQYFSFSLGSVCYNCRDQIRNLLSRLAGMTSDAETVHGRSRVHMSNTRVADRSFRLFVVSLLAKKVRSHPVRMLDG